MENDSNKENLRQEIKELEDTVAYMQKELDTLKQYINLMRSMLHISDEELQKKEKEKHFIEYFNRTFNNNDNIRYSRNLDDFFDLDLFSDIDDNSIDASDINNNEQFDDIVNFFRKFLHDSNNKQEKKTTRIITSNL